MEYITFANMIERSKRLEALSIRSPTSVFVSYSVFDDQGCSWLASDRTYALGSDGIC